MFGGSISLVLKVERGLVVIGTTVMYYPTHGVMKGSL